MSKIIVRRLTTSLKVTEAGKSVAFGPAHARAQKSQPRHMERILLCAHARQTVSVFPVVVAAVEGSQKLRTRDTTVAPRELGAGGGGGWACRWASREVASSANACA